MITTLVRRVVPLVCLAVAVAVLISKQSVPPIGSDGYFHLRIGTEFASGRWAISEPGHFSDFETAAWLPTQWLSEVGMAFAHRHGGMAAVIWLTGAMQILLLVAFYIGSRTAGAQSLPAALVACTALLATGAGLSARPQLISYILVVVFTVTWLRSAADGRPRHWLILLNWLWVPLHGMWFVGPLIGVTAVLGVWIEHPHDLRRVGRLALIPAASVVAAMFTPLKWHVFSAVTAVGSRARILDEWQPTDFTSGPALVLAAMIATVLLVGMHARSISWPETLLLGVAVCWGVYSVRTVDLAAAMTAPLLARSLTTVAPHEARTRLSESLSVFAIAGVGAVILWATATNRVSPDAEPAWIGDRLQVMPAGTRILNDWALGHNLLFRQEHLHFVMHGYLDMFTPEEVRRNVMISNVEPGWDSAVAHLGVDYALVRRDTSLGYALEKDDWTEVEGDKTYVLLTPPD